MTNRNKSKPRILFFDIETAPLKAYVWSPGKQYVGFKQLDKDHCQFRIICITYCFNDGKPAQFIDWGYEAQDTKEVIRQFDEIIKDCDFFIGKNSDKFDVKMINGARALNGLPGNPSWSKYTDDLEKQMRKYFRLPSQSLDYISAQLGYGGKVKMELQDWIDIVEKNKNGCKSLAKMIKYGKKDVEDTRALWDKLSEHFDSKWDQNNYIYNPDGIIRCKHSDCGSVNLRRNGHKYQGKSKYQEYKCLDCHRYAGRQIVDKR